MREMSGHTAGKIFLAVLALSVIAMLVIVGMGFMETPEGSAPVLIFGWITKPLAIGIAFIIVWLAAYLIYFFKYWPYR